MRVCWMYICIVFFIRVLWRAEKSGCVTLTNKGRAYEKHSHNVTIREGIFVCRTTLVSTRFSIPRKFFLHRACKCTIRNNLLQYCLRARILILLKRASLLPKSDDRKAHYFNFFSREGFFLPIICAIKNPLNAECVPSGANKYMDKWITTNFAQINK